MNLADIIGTICTGLYNVGIVAIFLAIAFLAILGPMFLTQSIGGWAFLLYMPHFLVMLYFIGKGVPWWG